MIGKVFTEGSKRSHPEGCRDKFLWEGRDFHKKEKWQPGQEQQCHNPNKPRAPASCILCFSKGLSGDRGFKPDNPNSEPQVSVEVKPELSLNSGQRLSGSPQTQPRHRDCKDCRTQTSLGTAGLKPRPPWAKRDPRPPGLRLLLTPSCCFDNSFFLRDICH